MTFKFELNQFKVRLFNWCAPNQQRDSYVIQLLRWTITLEGNHKTIPNELIQVWAYWAIWWAPTVLDKQLIYTDSAKFRLLIYLLFSNIFFGIDLNLTRFFKYISGDIGWIFHVTGYMGGNHHTHGGGADYICLPDIPQWGNVKDGFQNQNRMYSTEYDTTPGSETIFSKANNGGESLLDIDAVCVVCLVPTRSIQIMIPAKRTCPAGWTLKYRRYLASAHHTEAKTVSYASMKHRNLCQEVLQIIMEPCSTQWKEAVGRFHALRMWMGGNLPALFV